jgi:hypothetical protein
MDNINKVDKRNRDFFIFNSDVITAMCSYLPFNEIINMMNTFCENPQKEIEQIIESITLSRYKNIIDETRANIYSKYVNANSIKLDIDNNTMIFYNYELPLDAINNENEEYDYHNILLKEIKN